ncbi:protein XNDC1N [Bombina bombina]|uniref:protein XNDC1N n=1 Tax=Bombina bombina TaxID=8345 RepID=UPI00235A8D6F|nr:protein XNDC1N [Bombina bombina]
MAPIRIKHIVSFSSQDPKHPVENLLSESSIQPWLICPQDRSRQLKVELQLERACLIGYIDIGDFLADALGEKWDRIRISCSQPFNKSLFGLSFLRLRSQLDEEDENRTPAADCRQNEDSPEDAPGSQQHSCSIFRKMFIKGPTENDIQSPIKEGKTQQAVSTRCCSTACLSRTARMVLSAAESLKRRFPETSTPSLSPSHSLNKRCISQEEDKKRQSPVSSGAFPDSSLSQPTPQKKESTKPSGRRRLRMTESTGRRRRQPHLQEKLQTQKEKRDNILRTHHSPEIKQGCSSCPICGGYFRTDYLPTHASTCGEDHVTQSICLSSDDDSSDDIYRINSDLTVSLVPCPLCGFTFQSTEIERHASSCGV